MEILFPQCGVRVRTPNFPKIAFPIQQTKLLKKTKSFPNRLLSAELDIAVSFDNEMLD